MVESVNWFTDSTNHQNLLCPYDPQLRFISEDYVEKANCVATFMKKPAIPGDFVTVYLSSDRGINGLREYRIITA
jgi:hypothetical protein